MICYSRVDTDFIEDKFNVVHRSKGVILYVGGNNIRNRNGMFEWSEVLLKKFKELLVRAKEMGKVCVNGILPRLGENEEW